MHIRKKLTVFSLGFLGCVAAAGLFLFVHIAELAGSLPTPKELSAMTYDQTPHATEVFDRSGEKIGEFALERRYHMALRKIPKHVKEAFLAAEDREFYEHFGLSIKSIFRAALSNLRGGKIREGASTITQQLVRVYFLENDRTWTRKIKEAMLAVLVETRLTKDEILELYLNKIFFGNRSYGIESASRNYFRKSVRDLNIGEAALLAGLPKAPSYYAPHRFPGRASKRQKTVLKQMVSTGVLSPAASNKWIQETIKIERKPEQFNHRAPYFLEAVRSELKNMFEVDHLPVNGLKIHTTLSLDVQENMAATLKRGVARASKSAKRVKSRHGRIQGAMISIDPSSGAILAMQGGDDFNNTEFNRTEFSRRRLGPMYMPLYSTLALERGYTLATLTDKKKVTNRKRRALSVYEAILKGDVYEGARLYSGVGSGNIKSMAQRLGFRFKRSDLLLSLGYGKASALELASAYSAIANRGRRYKPFLVSKIESSDKEILYEHKLSSKKIFDANSAYIMSYALSENVAFGQAKQLGGFHEDLAAFGGSTDDLHNAWFVSYMPRLLTTVWLGAERGRTRLGKTESDSTRVAARVLSEFNRDLPPSWLRKQSPPQAPGKISFSRIPDEFKLSRSLPFVMGTEPQF